VAESEFSAAMGDDVGAPARGGAIKLEGDIGIAKGAGVSIVVGGGGLKPPGSSSDEPIGIPTRPTAASPAIPAGEEAVAAGFAGPTPAMQAPDTVPELMPASNNAVGSEIPVVRAAEPPQAELLPVIALCGTIPGNAAPTPGAASCVAPSGTPTGATGAPGPMPSGDVSPSGGRTDCAKAGIAPTSAVAAIRTGSNFIAILHLDRWPPAHARRADVPD
jgi:hypothetical protein